METKPLGVLAWAAIALAVILPQLAALYLAHHQSVEVESRRAMSLADDVLRRTEAAARQAVAAEQKLRQLQSVSCSDADIEQMRDIVLGSAYLQTLGIVKDSRLLCSSLGQHGEGLELGPVEYTSSLGAKIRTAVDLGLHGERRFLFLERNGVGTAIHPESLVDIFLDDQDVSLGVYNLSSGRAMTHRGPFDPAEEPRLRGEGDIFFDGHHLVAVSPSGDFDVAAYAAISEEHLIGRLEDFVVVLLPIGLLVGGALAFAFHRIAKQQASLGSMLASALRRQELSVHYQPIVEFKTRRVVGAEALLRWRQPDGTSIRPDVFIPAAEDCGMIQQLTAYVLDTVARDAPRLLRTTPDLYISINLSSQDLLSDTTVEALRQLLATPGIEPRNLIVEATEHSFLDLEAARQAIEEIRALGIRVAIDDFGTGYSSLSYLTTLRTDYLKIDRVFVDAVETDAATSEVAAHIIQIAESLGLELIAEGVESETQVDFLSNRGVGYGQGWLIAAAMPLADLIQRLDTSNAVDCSTEGNPTLEPPVS